MAANHAPASAASALTGFVEPGGALQAPAQKTNTMFTPGKGWQMAVDFKKQLLFPREIITTTTLRQDTVMCSAGEKRFLLIELAFP